MGIYLIRFSRTVKPLTQKTGYTHRGRIKEEVFRNIKKILILYSQRAYYKTNKKKNFQERQIIVRKLTDYILGAVVFKKVNV